MPLTFSSSPFYEQHSSPKQVEDWKQKLFNEKDKGQGKGSKIKWETRALRTASKEEVYEALVSLGRKPKNIVELKKEILKARTWGLNHVLEEAEKQHRYVPY